MTVTYPRGNVLLVTLAYSSQMGTKKRPVVVLRDAGDADLLVAPITSQPCRVAFDVPLADWPKEGLKLPSLVRTEKLATVEKSAIVRVLGNLSVRYWNAVKAQLAVVFREIIPS